MKKSDIDQRYSALRFSINLLTFWRKAGNAHTIHSPYLYDLYTRVIRSRRAGATFKDALQYRNALLCDPSELTYRPSGSAEGNTRRSSIRAIAKAQSTGIAKGRLLHNLVSHIQPHTIIELGTNLGIGTQFLASAWPRATIYSIEGSKEIFEVTREKFHGSHGNTVHLIQGEFRAELPAVLEKTGSPDFVFFDGDHRYQATLDYFNLCCAKANNNSVFVFDDIHWSPGMEKAWDVIYHDKRVTLAVDLYYLGLVFFRKELSKQFFCLRF